jgi:hypothetical protein
MNIEEAQKVEGGSLFSDLFHVCAFLAAFLFPTFIVSGFYFPSISYSAFLVWPLYTIVLSWKPLILSSFFVAFLHRRIERDMSKYFYILSLFGFVTFIAFKNIPSPVYPFFTDLKSTAVIFGFSLAYSFLTVGIYIHILRWRISRLNYEDWGMSAEDGHTVVYDASSKPSGEIECIDYQGRER